MIVLYIIGGVLLLLLLLLLIPVSVCITANDNLCLVVKYLFFKYSFEPEIGEKEDDKQEKDDGGTIKNSIKKKGIVTTVKELMQLAKSAVKNVVWLIKKITIKKLSAFISVADGDAAQTGITYGAVCSVVYPALGFLGTLTDISKCNVKVLADFDSAESKIDFEGEFSVLPIFVAAAAISVLYGYIKLKMADNNSISIERKN